MPDHKREFTLFGQDFKVYVKEQSDKRKVKVIDAETKRQKGHSFIIHSDEKKKKSTIIGGSKELPPRGEHVAEVTHEGIQKWLRHESKERSFEQEVEQAIQSTVKIWEQNFEKTEHFK